MEPDQVSALIARCIGGDDAAKAEFIAVYDDLVRRSVMRKLYAASGGREFESEVEDSYARKRLDEINHFRYGLTARIGFGQFNLYSYYGLDNMLLSNTNNKMHQFSLGVSLLVN